MTYSLPFNLKIKPARHYFAGGSVSFQVENGKLYYIVTLTSKTRKDKYMRLEVKSKDLLDKLSKVRNFNELHALEVVA